MSNSIFWTTLEQGRRTATSAKQRIVSSIYDSINFQTRNVAPWTKSTRNNNIKAKGTSLQVEIFRLISLFAEIRGLSSRAGALTTEGRDSTTGCFASLDEVADV